MQGTFSFETRKLNFMNEFSVKLLEMFNEDLNASVTIHHNSPQLTANTILIHELIIIKIYFLLKS